MLLEKTAAAWPPERWQGVTVLVGISGGADSVALARAMCELRTTGEGRLILAHYNHRLRGADSDGDQAFVEQLAAELKVPVAVGAGQTPQVTSAVSAPSEASLRDERYAFFAEAAAKHGARYVATAHTADDQVETVLFNILRGTGLTGAAGIPPIRPLSEATTLVRPLLAVSRAEVLDYLQSCGQGFREDATNAELNFTRNRIRHELLPLLEQDFNPYVRQAILRLSHMAGEANDLIDSFVNLLLSKIVRPLPGGVELQTTLLQQSPPLVARAALIQVWRLQGWPLQDMTFEKWGQLLALAGPLAPHQSQPPQETFPGGILAAREDDVLRLTRP